MNKNQPKISVVMLAYNTQDYIGQAIESILDQTFEDFELIIIDDCSEDKTWEIIESYKRKDNRIIAKKNNINLGFSKNRNKGTMLARGEYIAWQDSDDISLPQRLKKQYNFLKKHQDIGIVGGFLEIFDNNNKIIGVRKYLANDKDLRKVIFKYAAVAQPAAMIKKQCLNEVGGFDINIPVAEDLDMCFRIGNKYKLANLQEVILKYRDNPHGSTYARLKEMELQTIQIREKYSKGYNYKMTFSDRIYNFFQYFSVYIIPGKLKIKIFNLIRNKQ